MAAGDWTFAGGTFAFLEEGNPPLTPVWKHAVRTTVHPEMGGSSSTIHVLGFDTWTLEGRITIENEADYIALRDANGTFDAVDNGTDSWGALGIFDLNPVAGGAAGWEGTARFLRGS